ncbi:GNAT family N-acetyltransferase [Paenibacillus beijingensis]|uniref:GNAT family N-acetyltransferase n=1 Tax=Paenibacillus beijingensis TaxID=1126833 RepID=UPI000696D16A|nr:GNAT family N-acetyltransferase [Paenibacillus beijingensis]
MDNNKSLQEQSRSRLTVKLLSGSEWMVLRTQLLGELERWSEGRLTEAGMEMLASARLAELTPVPGEPAPAAAIAAAFVGGRLAGAAFARDAGETACIVAVHPKVRGRGLGSLLLERLQRNWGRLQCKVAADNTASLKMCFRAGMTAVALTEGPTGKPTLLFKSGPPSPAGSGVAAGDRKTPSQLSPLSQRPASSGLRNRPASGNTDDPGLRSGFASGKTCSSGLRSGFASGKTLRSGEIDAARTWHSNFIPQ